MNRNTNNSSDPPSELLAMLHRDGVLGTTDVTLDPLNDGVSSEIYRVTNGLESFVVKRALPRLKEKDEWRADTSRNQYERMFIGYVSRFLPQAMPVLRYSPEGRGYFVMELLGPEFTNWKRLLLSGQARVEDASRAAAILGTIHAYSAGDTTAKRLFDTTANFIQLRIDPYLVTTGDRYPGLRSLLIEEGRRLTETRLWLIHGDFSPKNLMVSADRTVLLDCEVAWYGDPAFDVAFLLTHLFLKALYHAPKRKDMDQLATTFWHAYLRSINEAFDARLLEQRVVRLLLMLLLARIDGKSPVEYLTRPGQRDFVRRFATSGLRRECPALPDVFSSWFASVLAWESR